MERIAQKNTQCKPLRSYLASAKAGTISIGHRRLRLTIKEKKMRKASFFRLLISMVLFSIASMSANAIPIQLNITQNVGGGFGLQPASTGSFSQLSPTATSYVINVDFKFFVDAFSTPVLGSVTGFADSVVGSATGGCNASDYVGFHSGSIALLASGPCLFSTEVNAARD